METLLKFGWNDRWEAEFEPYRQEGMVPGRVTAVYRERVILMTPTGAMGGRPSGTLRTLMMGAPAAVGDIAALHIPPEEGDAVMEALLPRHTAVDRQSVHNVHQHQALAANVDLVLIATSLNQDFNPARLERYLTVAWNSGAAPAILLTKADLCDDIEDRLQVLESIAIGVPVAVVSALTGRGLQELSDLWRPGETAVILGSSGVGKSTLLNALMGDEVMATRDIRDDDAHGRHTTTHRQMFRLPDGRLYIDTPGMREIAFDDAGGSATFSDIEDLARECRFSDCRHQTEPGCAIQQAIAAGVLPADRLDRYRKFLREERHEKAKTDRKARAEERQRDRAFGKMQKSFKAK